MPIEKIEMYRQNFTAFSENDIMPSFIPPPNNSNNPAEKNVKIVSSAMTIKDKNLNYLATVVRPYLTPGKLILVVNEEYEVLGVFNSSNNKVYQKKLSGKVKSGNICNQVILVRNDSQPGNTLTFNAADSNKIQDICFALTNHSATAMATAREQKQLWQLLDSPILTQNDKKTHQFKAKISNKGHVILSTACLLTPHNYMTNNGSDPIDNTPQHFPCGSTQRVIENTLPAASPTLTNPSWISQTLGYINGITRAIAPWLSARTLPLLGMAEAVPMAQHNISSQVWHKIRHAGKPPAAKNAKVGTLNSKPIIKFLQRMSVLDKEKTINMLSKEDLIAAAGAYLLADVKLMAKRERRFARKILFSAGLYGGFRDEVISAEQASNAIRQWVFYHILNASAVEYAAKEIASRNNQSYITLRNIRHLLSFKHLRHNSHINLNNLAPEMASYFNRLWYHCLKKELPFLYLNNDKETDRLLISDIEFANLASGSRYLSDKNILTEFNRTEIIQIGEKIWSVAINEGEQLEAYPYYQASALFFSAQKQPLLINTTRKIKKNSIQAIQDYFTFRTNLEKISHEFEIRYHNFADALKNWLEKEKIAIKVIDECPKNTTSHSLLQRGASWIPGMAGIAEKIFNPKEDYLNGIRPCSTAPDLTETYQNSTKKVAEHYKLLDELMISFTLMTAEKEDLEFIFAENAVIHSVELKMKTTRIIVPAFGHLNDNNIDVKLHNTDIVSVIVQGEERIYALYMTPDFGYKLTRTDFNIAKYINLQLLDYKYFGHDYVVSGNRVQANGETFEYHFYTFKKIIIGQGKNPRPLVDHLINKHYDNFYKALFSAGNDKSILQKSWSVFKEIIPFYSCIEGIIEDNRHQAIPACAMDLITLSAAFMQAISMGIKFSISLSLFAKGGGKMLIKGALRTEGKTLIKIITLPTINEWSTLGKHIIRGLDPMFEMLYTLTGTGVKYSNKLVRALGKQATSTSLVKKLTPLVSIKKKPLSANTYITARLPDSDIDLPVKKVASQQGKSLYVMVVPDTDEAFGKYYRLTAQNILKPWKKKSAKTAYPRFSKTIRKSITPDMYVPDIEANQLSRPNAKGIRKHNDGRTLVEFKKQYIEISERQNDIYFIKSQTGFNSIKMRYKKNKFVKECIIDRINNLKHFGCNGIDVNRETINRNQINLIIQLVDKMEIPPLLNQVASHLDINELALVNTLTKRPLTPPIKHLRQIFDIEPLKLLNEGIESTLVIDATTLKSIDKILKNPGNLPKNLISFSAIAKNNNIPIANLAKYIDPEKMQLTRNGNLIANLPSSPSPEIKTHYSILQKIIFDKHLDKNSFTINRIAERYNVLPERFESYINDAGNLKEKGRIFLQQTTTLSKDTHSYFSITHLSDLGLYQKNTLSPLRLDLKNGYFIKFFPDHDVYMIDPTTKRLHTLSKTTKEDIIAFNKNTIVNPVSFKILKGLNINLLHSDFDLSLPLVMREDRKPIPKIINYIWVGSESIPEDILVGIKTSRDIANKKGYRINFYLSNQSRGKNMHNIRSVLGVDIENNIIHDLEQSNIYAEFSHSKNYQQYLDAINGEQGKPTYYAAGADMLRHFVIKKNGGLYLDVDDILTSNFGKKEYVAADNELVLSHPVNSYDVPDMLEQYPTSFFGAHKDAPILDAMLEKMHERVSTNPRMYHTPRDQEGVFAKKLFETTGPGMFNAVIREQFPRAGKLADFHLLKHHIVSTSTDHMLLDALIKRSSDISTLEDAHVIGGLGSWKKFRR